MKIPELSPHMEDYLETIMLIAAEKNVARVKDVAENLQVKKPSVISALKKLTELGMIVHEHYGYIQLTEKGLQVAQDVYRRHVLLYEFFSRVLGVNEKTADQDACLIEHYLSRETRDRLTKFIEFVDRYPQKDVDAPWLVNFRRYMETGEVKLCDRLAPEQTQGERDEG